MLTFQKWLVRLVILTGNFWAKIVNFAKNGENFVKPKKCLQPFDNQKSKVFPEDCHQKSPSGKFHIITTAVTVPIDGWGT